MENQLTQRRPFQQQLLLGALAGCLLLSILPSHHADAQRRSRTTARNASTTQTVQSSSANGSDSAVVNIQTASAEELERLSGIGPAKAAAILSYRERRAFRRIEDIMRVRGIGRATFRHLRSMLTVTGPTTLGASTRSRRSH